MDKLSNYKWYNTCPDATMRTLLTFYRTVAFPLLLITVICAAQVWTSGSAYFVFRVFWMKVITTLIIGIYIAIFRSEQFIFFNNLGYTRTRVFVVGFVLDFVANML